MSVPPSNASATPTGARPRLAAGALLSRALRLAVMLVVIACGLMLLQTYRAMLHEAPAAAQKNAPGQTAAADFERGHDSRLDVEKTAEVFLRPGAWSLGESNWSLTLVDLSRAGAETRLQSLGLSPADHAKPSDVEKKILAWLQSFRPNAVNDCRVYNATIRSIRVRAVTEKRSGEERLRLVQIIWRQRGADRLLEASPAAAAGAPALNDGHLLPLPNGVASLARRWDGSGRLSCELLGPASKKECLRSWFTAGWTADTIGEAEGRSAFTVLRKEGRGIQLYPLQAGRPDLPAYLLLTAEQ